MRIVPIPTNAFRMMKSVFHKPSKCYIMNSREFFYLVAQMREAQKAYFKTRDQVVFRAARKLENEVDKEIDRVREIVAQQV